MSRTAPAPAAPTGGAPLPRPGLAGRLDHYFEITKRRSTIRREVLGGLTTFASMAYIVVLNPIIIGSAPDKNGDTLGFAAVAAVTALIAGVMTILMGVVGKVPFALATGLGLNAFLAYGVASKMTWPAAMGLVVVSGLIISVLVLTGVRQAIFHAIPSSLKNAIAVGIGLFVALIGFVDAGFVRRIPDAANTTVPVQLGSNGTLHGWPTVVFVLGLLVTGVLVAKKVRGGLLLGIGASTAVAFVVNAVTNPGPAFVDGKPNPTGWALNVPALPEQVNLVPDLHLLGNFSFDGFAQVGVAAALLIVFTLILSDFFDTMGTAVGLAKEADLLDENGQMDNAGRILFVDGMAAVAGGVGSASSATTYVESSAGIADGARTGLASVVTGVLFLAALFLTPLATMIPSEAAAPALIVVGVLMMAQVRHIDFTDLSVALPAFVTMVLMPFTYSITVGIGAGFITYVVLAVATGKAKTVHPLTWAVSAAFLVFFAQGALPTG